MDMDDVRHGVALPLPVNFCARVEALSPDTLVHIPGGVRAELALLSAENLEGMAAGDGGSATREWAMPRMLLAPVPPAERA
eukprot:1064135-Lingulodinium_polyedra.AAC.1